MSERHLQTSDDAEALVRVLERIAKALEAHNEEDKTFTNPHGDIIQTPEQTERIIRVQEENAKTHLRDIIVRERAANAWEEHNLWHKQMGEHAENHPPELN